MENKIFENLEKNKKLKIQSLEWNRLGIQTKLTEIKKIMGIRKFDLPSESPNCLSILISKTPLMCLDVEGTPGSVEGFRSFLAGINVDLNTLFYEKTGNQGLHIFFRKKPGSTNINKYNVNKFGIQFDVLYSGRVFTTPSFFMGRTYEFGTITPFSIKTIEEIQEMPDWVSLLL
jgi:hypothetical protein